MCNANELDANLIRDKFEVKQGDMINYAVTLEQPEHARHRSRCDVSAITLQLQFPGANGQPERRLPDAHQQRVVCRRTAG